MSIKIRVSYQRPQELEKVKELLRPAIKSVKVKQGQQNGFLRAYIDIKED